VEAQTTRARLPFGARTVAAKARKLLPGFTTIDCLEKSRVFYAGIVRALDQLAEPAAAL